MNEHKLMIVSNILYLIAISIITYKWWREKSRAKLLKLGWQEEIYSSGNNLFPNEIGDNLIEKYKHGT